MWLRESRGGLAVMATVTGACTGGMAYAFRRMITLFTEVFSGRADYSSSGHVGDPWARLIGPGFVVVIPVLAALLYGPFVAVFAPEARGHGVPEVLYAIVRRGGRIAGRVALVKAVASALCIGGGGSLGREGPIVQIGSAIGSRVGVTGRVADERVRLLVACGTAAGIAGTFNAPLAGVLFAVELILRTIEAEACAMVVLSSVVAALICRGAEGGGPQVVVPALSGIHPVQYVGFAVFGLIAGVSGIGFAWLLRLTEDGCDRLWRGPDWARPVAGAILLGGVLIALPEMYGVGDPVQNAAVNGAYGMLFCLVLAIGKAAAASLTLGIGGSGGVFGPCLFIGATLGSALGQALSQAMPGIAAHPALFALVGMAAVFAGASRAPLTAVAIVFELTGDPAVILPLLAAVVPAVYVSRSISPGTIYTIRLLRAGIDPDAEIPELIRGRPAVDVARPEVV